MHLKYHTQPRKRHIHNSNKHNNKQYTNTHTTAGSLYKRYNKESLVNNEVTTTIEAAVNLCVKLPHLWTMFGYMEGTNNEGEGE